MPGVVLPSDVRFASGFFYRPPTHTSYTHTCTHGNSGYLETFSVQRSQGSSLFLPQNDRQQQLHVHDPTISGRNQWMILKVISLFLQGTLPPTFPSSLASVGNPVVELWTTECDHSDVDHLRV